MELYSEVIVSSYFYSASQSCPILSTNCTFRNNLRLFRLFNGDRSGMMDKSSVFYIFLYIFLHICCERGAKSHVAKKISGRGRTRSREKGNQGVGDFRFINILQLNFSYLLFFFNYFTLSFFSIPFLPTKCTHTHDPRPTTFSYTPVKRTPRVLTIWQKNAVGVSKA